MWTGTPAGNFTVEVCNDPGQTTDSGAPGSVSGLDNWTTYTGSTSAAGGAAGSLVYDITTSVRWARIKYTRSGSTGSLTVARVHSKGTQ